MDTTAQLAKWPLGPGQRALEVGEGEAPMLERVAESPPAHGKRRPGEPGAKAERGELAGCF